MLDDLHVNRPDPVEIEELRRLLYSLYAIVELHFDQEDEGYFSLFDSSKARRSRRTARRRALTCQVTGGTPRQRRVTGQDRPFVLCRRSAPGPQWWESEVEP